MKKKNLLVLGALACGLLITSCGDSAEDSTTAYKLTVEKDSGVDSVTFTSDGAEVTNLTSLEEGTELTAKITLKDDYEISAVTLNGSAVNVTGGSYVFDMPATDSTFKVTTKEVVKTPEVKTFALTVEKDAGIKAVSVTKGGVALTDLTEVEEGSALVATITPEDGFTVSAVTLDGVALTLKDGAYAFNMPSKAATLKVTSAEIPPEVSTITVTNDDTKGSYTLTKGTETVSDGKVNVGDTVKLTVTPVDHFFVKDLTVNGSTVAYPSGGYEFTVTETAYAIAVNYVGEYTINSEIVGMGLEHTVGLSVTTEDGTPVADGSYVRAGTVLNVVVTDLQGGYGIRDAGYLYIYVNDSFVHGDDDSVVYSESDFSYTYTFTAGESETNIMVTTNTQRITDPESQTGYEIEVVENDSIKILGYEKGDFYSDYVNLTYFKNDVGYVISGVTVEYEDGTKEELSTSNYGINISEYSSTIGTIYLRQQVKGNCKITVNGEVKEVYEIKYEGLENVKLTSGTLPDSSIEGNIVNIGGIVSNVSGSRISAIEVTGVDKDSDTNYNVSITNYGASVRFTMPGNAVTIKFILSENGKVNITHDGHVKSYKFLNSSYMSYASEITEFNPGTNVYAFLTLEEGYLIDEVKDQNEKVYSVNYSSSSSSSGETVYLPYVFFTMPADGSDVNLTITTAKGRTIAVEENSDVRNISFGSYNLKTYVPGSDVTFNGYLGTNLKTVERIYYEDGERNKTDVEFTANGSSFSGTFVMPDSDVKFVVVVKDIERTNVPVEVISNVPDIDLSDVLSKFAITNSQSESSISKYASELEPMKLLENSSTGANFGINGNYQVSIAYVKSDGSLVPFDLSRVSYSTYDNLRTFDFTPTLFTTDYLGIRVTVDELKPLNAQLDNELASEVTMEDFTFVVNGEEVEDITKATYMGDQLGITLNRTAEEGYAYVVKLVDSDGEEISMDSHYKTYAVLTDFTIVVEKVQASKVTINIDEALADAYINYYNLSTYDTISDGAIFFEPFPGYVMIRNNPVACDIKITVGGEEIDSSSIDARSSYQSPRFEATGDVVITVTAHAE